MISRHSMLEMGAAAPDRLPDPMNPDAPIIPRIDWESSPYKVYTFQNIREFIGSTPVRTGRGPHMSHCRFRSERILTSMGSSTRWMDGVPLLASFWTAILPTDFSSCRTARS